MLEKSEGSLLSTIFKFAENDPASKSGSDKFQLWTYNLYDISKKCNKRVPSGSVNVLIDLKSVFVSHFKFKFKGWLSSHIKIKYSFPTKVQKRIIPLRNVHDKNVPLGTSVRKWEKISHYLITKMMLRNWISSSVDYVRAALVV